jgi:hypothetical protein
MHSALGRSVTAAGEEHHSKKKQKKIVHALSFSGREAGVN